MCRWMWLIYPAIGGDPWIFLPMYQTLTSCIRPAGMNPYSTLPATALSSTLCVTNTGK